MSDSRKVIVVVGATGAQGGGLVRAILDDPSGGFAVRALTRNVDSEQARALAARGAEVVAADVDNPESLKRAFAGAYGAFCVTFFWAHLSPDKEIAEARAMAQAAKSAGLQHVVWSTLEDTRKFVPLNDARMPTLMGKYKVPHFDAKAEADRFFDELKVPTTFLVASFYWENFISSGLGPKKGADGKYAIAFPMGSEKLAGTASEDIGRTAYGIFKRGKGLIGKTIGVAGAQLTGSEMAAAMTKALGIDVSYVAVPPDVFRGFGFPGADEIGNMFQCYTEFAAEFNATRDVEVVRSLNPALQNFDQWLAANKAKIPIEK